MRVHLMFRDQDFGDDQWLRDVMYRYRRDDDQQQQMSPREKALIQDLELDTLLGAMAGEDKFLFEIMRKALLSGLRNNAETIVYRQRVLKDCLKNVPVVRQIYDVTVQAIEETKRNWWDLSSKYPSSLLYSSIDLLEGLSGMLKKLRIIAEEKAGHFESEAFTTLFATLRNELSDEYLSLIQNHLTESKFRRGVFLSAGLGEWNESINYVLHRAFGKDPTWFQRLLGKTGPGYTFRLAERDEAGARILSEIRRRGISRVAIALAQSADHVLSFFRLLRTELGFYMGCLNLQTRLAAKGEPVCFPVPALEGERRHRFSGLYDVCLSLHTKSRVVGNSSNADGKSLVIVTGANQGGKSTFLRSIGLAQLMMQCGMFVGAETFDATLCPALFTHYKREEDPTMKSGKFDEELARMSEIADHVAPHSIVLFNESFAATNDREGSEIARQIVTALLEKRVKVFYVTHLYQFARGLFEKGTNGTLFLRAERNDDGTRTFRLVEGQPLETSFGEDLYRQVFNSSGETQERLIDRASPVAASRIVPQNSGSTTTKEIVFASGPSPSGSVEKSS